MMNFISFLIVTEIVMLENKHFYLSSTLKNRRLNYLKLTKINILSTGSMSCLLFEAFNGNEGSGLSELDLLYFFICLLYVLSQSVLQNVLAFKTIKLIDMIFVLIDLSYQIL